MTRKVYIETVCGLYVRKTSRLRILSCLKEIYGFIKNKTDRIAGYVHPVILILVYYVTSNINEITARRLFSLSGYHLRSQYKLNLSRTARFSKENASSSLGKSKTFVYWCSFKKTMLFINQCLLLKITSVTLGV